MSVQLAPSHPDFGKRRNVTPKLRAAVIERDERICRICDLPIQDGDELHIDHIIPVCAGGTNHIDNLQSSHARCNLSEGAKGRNRPYVEPNVIVVPKSICLLLSWSQANQRSTNLRISIDLDVLGYLIWRTPEGSEFVEFGLDELATFLYGKDTEQHYPEIRDSLDRLLCARELPNCCLASFLGGVTAFDSEFESAKWYSARLNSWTLDELADGAIPLPVPTLRLLHGLAKRIWLFLRGADNGESVAWISLDDKRLAACGLSDEAQHSIDTAGQQLCRADKDFSFVGIESVCGADGIAVVKA